MKGLTISGGGGQIGYLAGVYLGLHERGYRPDIIHGISSGALVGILAATNQPDRLHHLMSTVTDKMVVRKRNTASVITRHIGHWIGVIKPPLAIWNNDPLKKTLRNALLGKTTICDYYCGAYDLRESEYIRFSIPKGTTFTENTVDSWVAMVVASTAIPGVFDPVEWGDRQWWDGGLKYHTAIDPMERLEEIEHLIIITTKDPEYSKHRIKDILGVIKASISALLDIAAERGFERFELINHITSKVGRVPRKSGNGFYRFIPYDIYRPTKQLAPSTRFHHKYIVPDMEHGLSQVNR